jgi:hypothetical protein
MSGPIHDQIVADFVDACRERDRGQLFHLLRVAVERTSEKETRHLFDDVLPLHLGPKDLTWLLRQATDEEGFNRKRDLMLDALAGDLVKNGHVPGRDFSVVSDAYVGRRLCLKRQVWEEVKAGMQARNARIIGCFIRFDSRETSRTR